MSITWPNGLGVVFAVIVLIMAILGLVGVLPAGPQVVFGLVGALALARLT